MAPNGERKKKTSFVYCWEKKVLMKLSAPSSSSKKEELTNRAESIEQFKVYTGHGGRATGFHSQPMSYSSFKGKMLKNMNRWLSIVNSN